MRGGKRAICTAAGEAGSGWNVLGGLAHVRCRFDALFVASFSEKSRGLDGMIAIVASAPQLGEERQGSVSALWRPGKMSKNEIHTVLLMSPFPT